MRDNQRPNIPVPGGEASANVPDGIIKSNGFDPQSSLYDTNRRPPIQSGDWQHTPPPSPDHIEVK